MTAHIYLMKESNLLVSHCKCDDAYVTFPGQLDCPWCGCGWLFSCIACRKAFSFARAVLVDVSWAELARRDFEGQFKREGEPGEIEELAEALEEIHSGVELGERYVMLDGSFIPVTAAKLQFDGWHSRHDLGFVPQVAALKTRSIVD